MRYAADGALLDRAAALALGAHYNRTAAEVDAELLSLTRADLLLVEVPGGWTITGDAAVLNGHRWIITARGRPARPSTLQPIRYSAGSDPEPSFGSVGREYPIASATSSRGPRAARVVLVEVPDIATGTAPANTSVPPTPGEAFCILDPPTSLIKEMNGLPGPLPAPCPPTSHHTTRAVNDMEERLADAVHREAQDPDGLAFHRLSCRPHPSKAHLMKDILRELDDEVCATMGGSGMFLVRDISPTGAEHYFGGMFAADRPGIATQLMDVFQRLSDAVRPSRVSVVCQRLSGWEDMKSRGGVLGTPVLMKGRVVRPWSVNLHQILGYAFKPWEAAAPDGAVERDLRNTRDVFATGVFATMWNRSLEAADIEMAQQRAGDLKEPTRLWRPKKKRAAAV